MEERTGDKIICPECNKEVSLGFTDINKCPKCGSEKFDAVGYNVDY